MTQSTSSWRLALRLLGRDWRSGELLVLMIALVIAVTALTAVGFLTDRIGQAVSMRASASLAADLRLSSSAPLDESYLELAAGEGIETALLTSMPSVVFVNDVNTLASVRAVTSNYPLRGTLKTAERLLAPASETYAIPAPGEAWGAANLLARLGADVGDEVELGRTRLRITRVLDFRPDEGFSFVDLAPTLLINDADLAATGLIQPGSRVGYQQLFAGERQALGRFRGALEEGLSRGERLRDIEDSSPQIKGAMDRAGRFLNLASLISVLLSAIAVAMAARRYSHRHRDRVALMKCLGASQRYVNRTNAIQLLLLALLGGAIGVAFGFLGQQGLSFLLRDFIGEALPWPGMAPVWLGLVTSGCILGGFALPDLMQMGRTPPLRVLRQDIEPPPLRYGLGMIIAFLAVIALLGWMIRDAGLVTAVALGTLLTFAILGLAGGLLVKLMQNFRGAAGGAFRYGLANLSRRGRESIVQVVAFGLGIMVLLVLTLVRTDLMNSWQASLPADAPNRFLINIQPQEVDPIAAYLAGQNLKVDPFVPMVRARMTHLNGEDVTQISFEDPQGERWARREANLTFAAEPQPTYTITRGEWWAPDTRTNEVSVEEDFASELGLEMGDVLSFDIAGEPLEVTVTSFRNVAWDSFKPNFFMVMTPAALQDYPGTYLNSLYLPDGREAATLGLMRQFPSVTVIDLDAILGQVRDVMDNAAFAVQAVFIFTLLAGLAVLWAAVNATRDEREFESAMLRSMGASRRRVLAGVATEFLTIGALAGVLATAGATVASYFLATRVYNLEFQFNLAVTLAGPVAGALFVGFAGLIATRKVISAPPINVLRSA